MNTRLGKEQKRLNGKRSQRQRNLLLTLCPSCRRDFSSVPGRRVIPVPKEKLYYERCDFCGRPGGREVLLTEKETFAGAKRIFEKPKL